MWVLFARSTRSDAAYWPGRHLLAAMDAVLWPALTVWALACVPQSTGVVRPIAIACALLIGWQGLRTALYRNHRYRFVTWRVGRVAVFLVVVGWILKLLLS